jgi:hypothetical protein
MSGLEGAICHGRGRLSKTKRQRENHALPFRPCRIHAISRFGGSRPAMTGALMRGWFVRQTILRPTVLQGAGALIEVA